MKLRSIAFWSFLSLGALGIAACGGGESEGGLPECPSAGTDLTYDNFGRDFFSNNCTSCHSAGSGEAIAEDKPFDSQTAIQADAEEIYAQAVAGSAMPPGGGPSDEDRAKLGEWLSCGAK